MKGTSSNPELEIMYTPSPIKEREQETGSQSGVERLRLLWERRQLLFRCIGWGFAVATLVALLIPPRYESTTQLMPPDDKASSSLAMIAQMSGRMGGGLGAIAGDVLGLKSSGALFLGILTSRTVQDDVISKFDLRRVYWVRTWEKARRQLAANTSISEDRKSGIVTITVTDRDPQRAEAIAREYVNELNSVVTQLNTSSAHRERVFLEERLKQVRQDLEDAEREFSNFASKHGAIDIKEQAKAMVGAAATLQGELIAAESELQGMKQIYSDNNIRVRSLRARMVELEHQLEQLGGKEEIAADATSSQSGSLYPSIRKLPLLGVPYADLYRRTKVEEAVFETLTQEYELAKVVEAKETPSVKVLDAANLPERRSFPPRFTIIFLGVFLSFAVGVIWVLGSTAWEKIDAQTPGKQLVQDVFNTMSAYLSRASGKGSSSHLS